MADTLSPGEVVDRYVAVRRIGVGGMAEVWHVRHATLHTDHALKVLTLSGPSLKDRMVAEGRVQASLRHPNIVHVSDVVFVGGMPALVMEWVDGPDLKQWLAEARPDTAHAEQVFRGIVAGVAAAHDAGVIHRDLKPANVLLARIAGELVPKVGDFGIVKVLSGDTGGHTRSGMPMGTPQYMAPEQIRDAATVDRRADLFSLGCILYELLSGAQAYPGTDLIDIFERIDRGQRAPLPAGTPDRLARLVERCLARDPNDRPPDCLTLLAWLDGAPIDGVPLVDTLVDAPVVRQAAAPPPFQPIPWIVALALICGVGAMGLVTLAIVGFASRGLGAPRDCPTEGGRLGWVRAPAVFEKSVGSTWTLQAPAEVVTEPEHDEVVCRLPPGAQIRLVTDPVDTGAGRWVAVEAEQLAFGGPAAIEVEPKQVVGELCRGEPGVLVGWFHTRPRGIRVPKKGGEWQSSGAKQVVADYPRPENGHRVGPPVCALPAGSRVEVTGDVVRSTGVRGYWVPIIGGSILGGPDARAP